ncbi:MAG: BON domain-containing protein [Pseudomonas sp.]|uniref:BON domain-containing protein n=1 Tax=Pseudomonas sp. TaxID=306 RepID=UPI000D80AB42
MNKPFNKFVIAAATAGALLSPLAFADVANTHSAPLMMAATTDTAEEAVTDTWITSKVKSTFVADSALSALDIKVETNKGVVSLSGVVKSDAERDLAVAKTKGIKGVKAVSADGLKSAE